MASYRLIISTFERTEQHNIVWTLILSKSSNLRLADQNQLIKQACVKVATVNFLMIVLSSLHENGVLVCEHYVLIVVVTFLIGQASCQPLKDERFVM